MTGAPVVVVGASLAGLRAVEAIRAGGYGGELIVLGDEPHAAYTRPPLSKELLAGTRSFEDCALAREQAEATWLHGTTATSLDLARRVVRPDDNEFPFSRLRICTAARARPWPHACEAALDGVYVLRGIDDALALRRSFEASARVAIVGAGFIGCEVAATARARGLEVTLIAAAAQPMGVLGFELVARCAELHRAHGVDLRLEAGVASLAGHRRVEAVRLVDGSEVATDVVLVALGAIPNSDWLEGSGLLLEPGVRCDQTLAALGAEGVFCAGDIAAWPHPLADGDTVRIEHWTVAAEQGSARAKPARRERRAAAVRRRPLFLVRPIRRKDPIGRTSGAREAATRSRALARRPPVRGRRRARRPGRCRGRFQRRAPDAFLSARARAAAPARGGRARGRRGRWLARGWRPRPTRGRADPASLATEAADPLQPREHERNDGTDATYQSAIHGRSSASPGSIRG